MGESMHFHVDVYQWPMGDSEFPDESQPAFRDARVAALVWQAAVQALPSSRPITVLTNLYQAATVAELASQNITLTVQVGPYAVELCPVPDHECATCNTECPVTRMLAGAR